VLIVALLLPLLLGLERFRRYDGPVPKREFWLAVVPLHILAGWISVATFASFSTTLDVMGVLAGPRAAMVRDLLLVLLAGTVGAVFARRARAPLPYGLTLVWGLAGIIVKNTGGGSLPVAGAAGLAIAVVGAAMVSRRAHLLPPLPASSAASRA
jgi:hypothetical protein